MLIQMEDFQVITAGYRCGRSKANNQITVYNEYSYVMAEYSQRSGVLIWHRVVIASQKAIIENWLYNHFPAKANKGQANK